jgi:TOBE domain
VAQVGRPEAVYAQPADAGLARFLGAANLLPADTRGAVADTAFGPLTLTSELQGDALALVRPEQISMIEGHGAGSGNLRGRVVELSYQGHETLVTVCPGNRRRAGDDPGPGAGPGCLFTGDSGHAQHDRTGHGLEPGPGLGPHRAAGPGVKTFDIKMGLA